MRPGTFSAELVLLKDGATRDLAGPVSFEVTRLYEPSLPGSSLDDVDAFWKAYSALAGQVSGARYALDDAMEDVATLRQMLAATAIAPGEMDAKLSALEQELYDLDEGLTGQKARRSIQDKDLHRVNDWLNSVSLGLSYSTYGPTATHRKSLTYAQEAFEPIRARLNAILETEIPALRQALLEAGAPWGPGQRIPEA